MDAFFTQQLDETAKRIGCLNLYRYRPINSNEIDALEKSYLWHQPANDLNDPFEGSIKLKEREDDTTLEIGVKATIRRNRGRQEIQETILEFPNIIRETNKWYQRAFKAMLPKVKICCFSRSNKIDLMWSHYAGNHKGMVLEYDISYDINKFGFAVPVLYHETLPEIDFMAHEDKTIVPILKNKSDKWSYEQEVRIINDNPDGAPNRVHINPQALRSVIFGCKTSSEDKEKVRTALKRYPHITYKQCRKSENDYALIIESLPLE